MPLAYPGGSAGGGNVRIGLPKGERATMPVDSRVGIPSGETPRAAPRTQIGSAITARFPARRASRAARRYGKRK